MEALQILLTGRTNRDELRRSIELPLVSLENARSSDISKCPPQGGTCFVRFSKRVAVQTKTLEELRAQSSREATPEPEANGF